MKNQNRIPKVTPEREAPQSAHREAAEANATPTAEQADDNSPGIATPGDPLPVQIVEGDIVSGFGLNDDKRRYGHVKKVHPAKPNGHIDLSVIGPAANEKGRIVAISIAGAKRHNSVAEAAFFDADTRESAPGEEGTAPAVSLGGPKPSDG